MTALDDCPEFTARYGVIYLGRQRDGADFNGRARRIARRLGLEQDRRDVDLFVAHGGRLAVGNRLALKWDDPARALTTLTAAEERLMLMIAVETNYTAPLEIKRISDVVGYGVFAGESIRARDVIGVYTGVLRKNTPEDADNGYLAHVPDYGPLGGYIIDGRDEGNVTRFTNHSQIAANVSNEFVFHLKRWHRVLRADRTIRPGEQILWDYGDDYWRERERPLDLW